MNPVVTTLSASCIFARRPKRSMLVYAESFDLITHLFYTAVFSDRDMESIQRVGAGLKTDRAEVTGQFGLGFNAVYHLTDVPSFVTRDKLVMFDPHRAYVPDIAPPAPPGRYFRFASPEIHEAYGDQLAPYVVSCAL